MFHRTVDYRGAAVVIVTFRAPRQGWPVLAGQC